jgi:ER degradation enhancer, mannosidase alpha-like 2
MKLQAVFPGIVLLFTVNIASAQITKTVSDESPVNKKEMANLVKAEYRHAWEGYKKFAWGYDALQPLSKKGHNWYPKSLLMTPVDALDGMLLMGLKAEATEAKSIIFTQLRFDDDMDVQNFEISIRLLGGLLAAYELDGDKRFLGLATDLADRLIRAFDSPTGMPYRYVNLVTGKTRGNISNPAEIGTYLIEYGTLSKHTGNPKYYDTARKAMIALYERRSPLGLTGSSINVETGEWTNTESHISGGIDSYLEYMLKASVLFNNKEMKDMWLTSITAINKYLADEQPAGFWYAHADMNSGKIVSRTYGSLDAFFAATLAMNGDLPHAEALQESNFKMFMLQDIEPEYMDYSTMTILDSSYALRPENIESAYYLYQYTKDEKYLYMGRDMFLNIVKYCRTPDAYAALKNVVTKEKQDEMESFFFAETLKYAFLLFDDNQSLNFDKVIFNTEAHPFRR